MSEESKKSTLQLHGSDRTDTQIDTLRGLIPANWKSVGDSDATVIEADLGENLPTVRLEEIEDQPGTWVGVVDAENSGDVLRTAECDSHNAAAIHLRQRLHDYAELLEERAAEITEIAEAAD